MAIHIEALWASFQINTTIFYMRRLNCTRSEHHTFAAKIYILTLAREPEK